MQADFSNPQEVFNILTNENADYDLLLDYAKNLSGKIPTLHTNKDGNFFQTVSQCILECLKIMHNFKSTSWVSGKKLEYELKTGEDFLTFSRIGAKGEAFTYKIVNFDQIDFDKPKKNITPKTQKKPPIIIKKPALQAEEDDALQKIINYLNCGNNVFVTGHAGTGKSYILGRLKEKYKKKLTITSTTGIAAVNAKGQTLHSWAGVGLCRNLVNTTVEKIKTKPSIYRQITNCKMLAIDEISMLNIETFEYVDRVLKLVRENSAPFGGIQVIFIGDFFQLPPVEKETEFERHYCFDSPLWDELDLKNIILTKNYRQNEKDFIKALSNMRLNKLDESDIDLLYTRNIPADSDDFLHIFSTNEEADRYNFEKFNALPDEPKTFTAKDGVYRGKNLVSEDLTSREEMILEIFDKNCRAPKNITLKKGCRVMLLVNMDFQKSLINGACGTVKEFNENSINIDFDNGVNSNIPLNEFEYYYNDKAMALRLQYPLKLAYGITIHKSQGMTLDRLVVDCSRIFERGQVYVAMSRVRNLNGLYLKSFNPDKVYVDRKVAKFYKNLEEAPDIEPQPEENNLTQEDVDDAKVREIIFECVKEFNEMFGKTTIGKILTGSKSLENKDYAEKVMNSRFYEILKGSTRKSVCEIIDEMTEENIFKVKHISFGRPILAVNK